MPDLIELGQTGTQVYGNQITSIEWVAALTGQQMSETINRMRMDAVISAVENGFLLPIKQADWKVDYPPEYEKTPQMEEISNFIVKNLSEVGLSKCISEAFLSVPYGFMLQEPVWKIKDGKYWLKKLSPRMPSTVYKWYIGLNGEFLGIQQQAYRPTGRGESSTMVYPDIPAEKLVLITHRQEGGDYQGRSEYRPLYREYRIKDLCATQLAITIDRVGSGIPTAILNDDAPIDNPTTGITGAKSNVEEVLKGLQGNESAYMVLQFVKDLKFFNIPADSIDSLIALMKYCDESIAKSAFQMFLSLGTSTTGSRSLGESFIDLYYMALQSIVDEIAEAYNSQLIKRMVDYNFPGKTVYPKLSFSFHQDISPVLQTLAVLKEKQVIKGNTDIENFVLDWFGLPLTNESNVMPPSSGTTPTAAPGVLASCGCGVKMSDGKPGRIRRNRELSERELKLADIDASIDGLNGVITDAADELKEIAMPFAVDYIKAVVEDGKPYLHKIEWGNKIADTVKRYYQKVEKMGKQDVKKELVKQAPKLSERVYGMKLADTAVVEATKKYNKYKELQSAIDSEQLRQALESDILSYYSAASQQGLTGQAAIEWITAKLVEEVGKRWEDVGTSITAAYSMAREISAEEFADTFSVKVRTEAMDSGTCLHCSDYDGREYRQQNGAWVDDDGNEAISLPDPDCAGMMGGNQCRGIYMYEVG